MEREELLILTKTYPNPSTKYRETTCVAALNRNGEMRRLYPIPFRFLDGAHQFRKWEWIQASLIRAKEDRRPESYRIDIDTIVRTRRSIGPEDNWRERLKWIEPHVVPGMKELELRRQATGETLGFLRARRLVGLEIKPLKESDWTSSEKVKLAQDGLFDSAIAKGRPPLRKIPYSFHYIYECESGGSTETCTHKITDWEAGALYWNCVQRYGGNWGLYFREKLEVEFAKKDLLLLMGTIHRFPDQWLIVGLVYPPKPEEVGPSQLSLSDEP